MTESDRTLHEALSASVDSLLVDDVAYDALSTVTSMLRLIAGETLVQFDHKGRLLALSALLNVAQGQLARLTGAVAAELAAEETHSSATLAVQVPGKEEAPDETGRL